jgi:hypothetical protein
MRLVTNVACNTAKCHRIPTPCNAGVNILTKGGNINLYLRSWYEGVEREYRKTACSGHRKTLCKGYFSVHGLNIKKDRKVKLSLCLTEHRATKTCGEWRYNSRILNLGTWCKWVISFTHRPLHPRVKGLWYPLNRRRGGPQSQSGGGGKEKNSLPLPGMEPRQFSP